ncbi:hypothetical protein COEREDRAFT_83428 [Coemansia reversa NRRL 1564]|uniref:WIBG Mago-binding domain-containing protein n=1 Tax=Coemansia reversa (strain ATCC 12441 / NRRL 1564) TaxID=763665 RepID=A0A2G5B3C6_COERN|nr:hypothetical protein COEREDRAFT_83428 [Coemansia reversa NRRL 1564]|eukprot:PIA13504.1 hypothetical protein COEREDRAFT_83428 [Coemansia reversa NRRL 1564]
MDQTQQVGGTKQSQQQRIVPESRRPDGTIRRARKIRNGYVPPEEQQKYQSPAIRRMQQTCNLPNEPVKPNSRQSQPKPLKQDATLRNTDASEQSPSVSPLNKAKKSNDSQSVKTPEKYIPPFMRKRMEAERQARLNNTNTIEKQTKDTKTNVLASKDIAKLVESINGLSLDQTKNK